MNERTLISGLAVDTALFQLINDRALPPTGLDQSRFWDGFAEIIHDLTPKNRELLKKRESLETQINEWHQARQGQSHDPKAYRAFLEDIGYLVAEGPDFTASTKNVDDEITAIPGPQLVVPVNNARYAINAANARWGSLYDALYGTDVIADSDGTLGSGQYNPERGQKVVAYANDFLDTHVPLADLAYGDATRFCVTEAGLSVERGDGGKTGLADPNQFAGYRGDADNPSAILLQHNRLHIEMVVDRSHPVGSKSAAGISDVILESAITVIQDCEDSVAAVDGEDKTLVYANWLGLMQGTLSTQVAKGGGSFERRLNPDREYVAPDGSSFSLPGRALMLVRNVGHLMTTPAILDKNGDEVYEGIMDAVITALIALHDLNDTANRNSRTGAMYVVKPKMHGPEETAFCVSLFERTEALLGMRPGTMKVGIMDEERRTTVNLKECIRVASDRVIFINTGFLDRTGDEIHTAMEAGPMIRKADMKAQPWIKAYE
ncbi:MAG: malate synthase G, partial [Gammaproteobacteria bacterium]